MRALVVDQVEGKTSAALREIEPAPLEDGNVLVKVEYSTINYKDGLAIAKGAPVVRKWPMIAGIDGAGIVEESADPAFQPGDRVVVNGWGLGEIHWGCLAEKASLKGAWLQKLPPALSNQQAMAIGTAGYTAALCVTALEERGVTPESGDILVTGATGGVGSIAISLLSQAGFRVVASTGHTAEADYLKELGAAEIIDRETLSAPGKPLQRERWAGAIDVAGSTTLANICASMQYGGTVAACGLAQGMDLPLTVAPFILRSVGLIGIDSVMAPMARRVVAWERLARDLDMKKLDAISRVISLDEVIENAPRILAGEIRGRLAVKIG
ncbi:acrylyl-CoA reductase (NADPH) [Pseudochelatococcus sp. B33]